ncbi:MAG: hypothetical protein CMF12_13350 [Idiomarina sp.]|uniref:Mpo1 family 2-hydroxy fatty acid dioxygenase n=1 Tax=Idiomarina sp. TaxID=1874361 RepID=UPI000C0D3E70|nr:Mpo1-like protein [Idiomarina sp.]MAK71004.1 hypothetical protein [Idiomarinaceae bacterium]MBL4741862.1 DUF962 domain-containing protein [Idiomarina sp.]MBT43494.1 hypothetical protein [Idiomarina sp.]PHQ77517.1 MAG: hypothetical protein COB75_02930 [Idiomarina sp.]HAD49639.1 hypothetical protein [Idiomarina sp.]
MSNKTVAEHLAQYGDYHRDRRNIMTHLVGIPMIVIAILTLLSRPEFSVAYLLLTPANLVVFAAVIFYIRLDIKLGLLMTVLLWLCLSLGRDIAAMSTLAWLSWGIGLFIVGWIFQFIGHYYEGRKPAFVDDIIGLAIGPLFVVAEVVFMLGLRPELKRQVERQR